VSLIQKLQKEHQLLDVIFVGEDGKVKESQSKNTIQWFLLHLL
jgi:hypothetical protein